MDLSKTVSLLRFFISVSIWLSKHRAARKYRYELQQQTSQLIRLELLLDMLLNLLEREKR